MLQSVNHTAGETVESRQGWRWSGLISAAGLVVLTALSVEAGHKGVSYLAAVLGAACAAYVLYLVVLLRRRSESEVMPHLRAAHQRTPGLSFERWLALEVATVGTVHAGSEEAAMHLELGTLSMRHLH
jgi:hypothetical protein